MKGVIVQVGDPKSIVLFNNGKISAIPTPLEAHVGMVVGVKLNTRAKVLAVTVAICLVLAAGIGIGIFVAHSTAKNRHQHDTSGYSFQKGKAENQGEVSG